ncbi:MAG: DegT/DnrJ/EryC1/StrS family aminotransferase [Candidatus Krumholzibacteriota bacterium]|nr:DegT/DnrJ/EryC1/StrS family aminotransferase [Candidatus Krumholzibacteriota bacterium]
MESTLEEIRQSEDNSVEPGITDRGMTEPIPIIRPNLPLWENVEKRLKKIYSSRMLTNHSTVSELESTVARYLEVDHVVALSCCTSGLMLAMKALGITGEVIVPSFTFSATGHAIYWAGAKPVFVDCNNRDWNISIESAIQASSEETSAILAVHIFGNPAPVAALEELAKELGVPLIFDAAHAFGGSVSGRMTGGFGDVEIFSLSPTKLITGGEGGLLTTNDSSLAEQIRYLRNYGNKGDYDCFLPGLNARMPEFNAALILEGLPLVAGEIAERERLASVYREELSGIPGIAFQEIPEGNQHTWKDLTVTIDPYIFGMDRDKLHTLLHEENIMTKKYFYPPLHKQSGYSELPQRSVKLTVTEWLSNNVLTLPLYSALGESGIRKISDVVKKIHSEIK